MALIEHGLERARTDGVPAFLITARPKLVPLYQRRGLRDVQDADARGMGRTSGSCDGIPEGRIGRVAQGRSLRCPV